MDGERLLYASLRLVFSSTYRDTHGVCPWGSQGMKAEQGGDGVRNTAHNSCFPLSISCQQQCTAHKRAALQRERCGSTFFPYIFKTNKGVSSCHPWCSCGLLEQHRTLHFPALCLVWHREIEMAARDFISCSFKEKAVAVRGTLEL